jgi:hypothetical protein
MQFWHLIYWFRDNVIEIIGLFALCNDLVASLVVDLTCGSVKGYVIVICELSN